MAQKVHEQPPLYVIWFAMAAYSKNVQFSEMLRSVPPSSQNSLTDDGVTLNDIQQNLGTEVGYLDMQAVRWLCPALRPVLSLTRDHVF